MDIRAVSSAAAPEILEYRFQQDVLERLANVAEKLPQVVQIGRNNGEEIDFLQIARRMIGTGDEPLFTPGDLQAIRDRMAQIEGRISERSRELEWLSAGDGATLENEGSLTERPAAEEATADRVEEIRQSVTDEAVRERVERAVNKDDEPESFETGHRNGAGEEE